MSSDRPELYSGETRRKFSYYKDWACTPSWGRFAGWVCKLRHFGAYICEWVKKQFESEP